MYKILISAVGGDIGQGILKSLRATNKKYKIIGCDMNPDSAGVFLCDKGYVVAGAKNNPKKYIQQIIQICKKEKIDIVFSAQPYELNVLCAVKEELQKKTGAYFAIQSKKVWDLSMDKLSMYHFLKSRGINYPETYDTKKSFDALAKKYGLPLLVKTRESLGSGFHDFVLVNNKKDLAKCWKDIKNPIIQQYINNKDDEEYTVGIFLDKNSKALGAIAMLRKLRFGLTFHAIVGDYTDVIKAAIKTAESMGAVGPCNVQLRKNSDGATYVIEVNARISSTTAFRSYFGFNEAKACIDYFLDSRKLRFSLKKGVAMKTWDEEYVSVDDYNNLKKKGFFTK